MERDSRAALSALPVSPELADSDCQMLLKPNVVRANTAAETINPMAKFLGCCINYTLYAYYRRLSLASHIKTDQLSGISNQEPPVCESHGSPGIASFEDLGAGQLLVGIGTCLDHGQDAFIA